MPFLFTLWVDLISSTLKTECICTDGPTVGFQSASLWKVCPPEGSIEAEEQNWRWKYALSCSFSVVLLSVDTIFFNFCRCLGQCWPVPWPQTPSSAVSVFICCVQMLKFLIWGFVGFCLKGALLLWDYYYFFSSYTGSRAVSRISCCFISRLNEVLKWFS